MQKMIELNFLVEIISNGTQTDVASPMEEGAAVKTEGQAGEGAWSVSVTTEAFPSRNLYDNASSNLPWQQSATRTTAIPDSTFKDIDPYGQTVFTGEDILFYVYYFSLLFMLSVINFAGNGLVIYCVLRHRRLRVPANYFIVSLACSDLILGALYPIYNVSHMEAQVIEDTLGQWASCTTIITLTLAMLNISSYNLVGITVTRYISIRDPLKFIHRVSHGRALAAVCLVWTSLLAIGCLLYLRTSPPSGYKWCRYENVLHSQPVHVFLTCFVSMLIPLFIMTALYAYMAVIARKQARAIFSQERKSSTDSLRGSMLRHELKMFRMAGTLLGYFTLAWAPFVIFEFVTLVHRNEVNRYIRATVRIVLHSNSAVNAFIYAGRLHEFRDALRGQTALLSCSCRRRSSLEEVSVDLSSRVSQGERQAPSGQGRHGRFGDARRRSTVQPNGYQHVANVNCRRDAVFGCGGQSRQVGTPDSIQTIFNGENDQRTGRVPNGDLRVIVDAWSPKK